MTHEYVGSEEVDPAAVPLDDNPMDGFSPRYRVTWLCKQCGRTFAKVVKAVPKKDPPCPRKACKAAIVDDEVERRAQNLARIIETQRTPGIIGDKPMVGVIDKTAEIVMQDNNLTNLKDNIREGESMAPKLPGQMQAMADGFFGGKAVAERRGMRGRQAELMGRRAVAGAFRGMSVTPNQIFTGGDGNHSGFRPVDGK